MVLVQTQAVFVETTIDGQPAFRASFRWTNENGVVEQAIAWIDADAANALTVTCTGFGGRREAFEELDRLLASLRLGARESMVVPNGAFMDASPSSPPPPPEDPARYGAVPMPGARRSSPNVERAASSRKERT